MLSEAVLVLAMEIEEAGAKAAGLLLAIAVEEAGAKQSRKPHASECWRHPQQYQRLYWMPIFK